MRAALEPGAELAPLRVTPDRYVTARYAGASGDFNPIHLDDEFARSVGLPGRILHGLYTMALIARAQTEALGGPGHLRRLSVQFRGAAVPEEEIVVSSTVKEADGATVIVTATAQQLGKAVVRGATAELSREPGFVEST
ncbi:MAG TPA: MaoC/PaaZ C-terminal domain-containing protein [Solirubrobacteraceae bacterium]|jgi:acyl dehydratase|nr:MaoC/PaaZ C-terminal domain-containing protein [Solirubrobacteraceae bacterium]